MMLHIFFQKTLYRNQAYTEYCFLHPMQCILYCGKKNFLALQNDEENYDRVSEHSSN